MPIVKNTLQENYIFFLRELSRIEQEIKAKQKDYDKSREYLNTLPSRWQRTIKKFIESHLIDF